MKISDADYQELRKAMEANLSSIKSSMATFRSNDVFFYIFLNAVIGFLQKAPNNNYVPLKLNYPIEIIQIAVLKLMKELKIFND